MKLILSFSLLLLTFVAKAQPFRTPILTGNATADFKIDEKNFSSGVSYCLTWDANNLYIGVTGPEAYIKDEPTILYMDTDPATSPLGGTGIINGFNYDSRSPQLPFTANLVLYLKTGYAEVRTCGVASGIWSDRIDVTTAIKTGATDIEIKLPWSIIPGGVRPLAFSHLWFKTNGNSALKDVYECRPGITNVGESYGLDINLRPPQLFYTLNTTENGYFPGVNLFSWIYFGPSCAPPASLSTSSITSTSVKLNWSSVLGATQYEVRGRRQGTSNWQSAIVPGNKTSVPVTNLTCNKNYEWHIRTICDTTQLVNIYSGFSALIPFKTASCASFNGDLSVYPNPAKRNTAIYIKTSTQFTKAHFTIYNQSGIVLQKGELVSNNILLNNKVTAGTYLLELVTNDIVIKKVISVTE